MLSNGSLHPAGFYPGFNLTGIRFPTLPGLFFRVVSSMIFKEVAEKKKVACFGKDWLVFCQLLLINSLLRNRNEPSLWDSEGGKCLQGRLGEGLSQRSSEGLRLTQNE